MINPQWLELQLTRTNFHGAKDVRAFLSLMLQESQQADMPRVKVEISPQTACASEVSDQDFHFLLQFSFEPRTW